MKTVLRALDAGPNDRQACIAAYSVTQLETVNSQMWELPAGMGKSRVIATMALILALSNFKVHIVVPIEALMERDKKEYNEYWVKSNTSGCVVYHTGLNFEIPDGDIIICDEADYLMFKDPNLFYDVASKSCMIAMTAS